MSERTGATIPRWKLILLSDPEPWEILNSAFLVFAGVSLLNAPSAAVAAPITLSARLLFGEWTRLLGASLFALAAVKAGSVLHNVLPTRRATALLALCWWLFATFQVAAANGPLDIRVGWCLLLALFCAWARWRLGRPGVRP